MKRDLRSSALHKREECLLDLNKHPCENERFSSDSDSSADYFSAEVKIGDSRSGSDLSECERDANSCVNNGVSGNFDSDDLGKEQKLGKGKDLESPKCGDNANAAGCALKNGLPLVLTGSVQIKEETNVSEPSGCGREPAGVVDVDVCATCDVHEKVDPCGKLQRGRKRKAPEIRSSDGAMKGNSEKELILLSSVQKGTEEKSSGLESRKLVKIEEDCSESKVADSCEDADMGGDLGIVISGDAGGNTNEDRQKFSKGRRGRKRKVAESLGAGKDEGVIVRKAENLALESRPCVVGKVLRSRTITITNPAKQAYGKENAGCVGVKIEKEIHPTEKKNIDVQMEGARVTQGGKKKMKGRRGRPPKMQQGDNGKSRVIAKKKVKLGSQRNVKLPKAQDVNSSNILKMHGNGGAPGLVDNEKKKTRKFKKRNDQLTANGFKFTEDGCQNRLTPEQNHSGESITRKALKCSSDEKEGVLRRSEEKQLLRDQIISILKNAGWTIDYKLRMSKEYHDTIYVDCVGRQHWSVTKAYKTLKQEVENGTADAKAISAFSPIPEDKLSILYRITKEKKKKCQKQKKDVNTSGKKAGKEDPKTSALEVIGVSKWRENLDSSPNPGNISTRKKTKKDTSGQNNSMTISHRGKRKSNRGAATRKPCILLARGSENGADGFELYDGKHTLLSWMIDMGTVPLDAKVHYMKPRRQNVLLKGKINRDGICCGCCDGILTLSDFESHAGSKLGQPFDNIYLESGHSLLQCLSDSWSRQEQTDDIRFNLVDVNDDDPNDDTCNICGDGGDLICCDGCPSTFHQSCLQIQKLPSGHWRCVYCSCKFCGMVDGRVHQIDNAHHADNSELLACLLCEEKFHGTCVQEKDAIDINVESLVFCGRGCQKIFEHLQKLLGMRHELEEGFSWTILQRQDVNRDTSHSADPSKIECNSKLAIAFSIMDECFLPIIDPRSNINMVKSVLYSCGSNFRRLNYSGFYTFILERGDELVSAAAIRIHGSQLAEMPFIGTRYMYRRQGMCRRLLTAIEMALSSLDIEKLVIPAISELNKTWTKVFGFSPLEVSERQEMKQISMIVFPRTNMLQKPLHRHQLPKGYIISAEGTEISQLPIGHVEGVTTPGPGSDASSEANFQRHDESAAAAAGSHMNLPDCLLNDGPVMTIEVVNSNVLCEDAISHDFGVSSDKFESSKTTFNHSIEHDMQNLSEGMTSASPQCGSTTVCFPHTEPLNCNIKSNQFSECSLESKSLISSMIGPLEIDPVEKMLHVPEEEKEPIQYQHKAEVTYLKPVDKDNYGETLTCNLEDSTVMSRMVSDMANGLNGMAIHAIFPPNEEMEKVADHSNEPQHHGSFGRDANKVHQPVAVTSVDTDQVALSVNFPSPAVEPESQVSDGGNSLKLHTEVITSDISDIPGDKLFSLTSAIRPTQEALSNVNHGSEPYSMGEVSLCNGPQLCLKSSIQVEACSSVNSSGTVCNCGSFCNSSSHPDPTCLSNPGNSKTCVVSEVASPLKLQLI